MKNQGSDDLEDVIDRRIGVFIEHMNDQFERVIEAVQTGTQKIPKIDKRLEVVEHDTNQIKLFMRAAMGDHKLIKVRTEKHTEQLDNHEERISLIEKAA